MGQGEWTRKKVLTAWARLARCSVVIAAAATSPHLAFKFAFPHHQVALVEDIDHRASLDVEQLWLIQRGQLVADNPGLAQHQRRINRRWHEGGWGITNYK